MFLYALQALPSREISVAEAQISVCAECRRVVETIRRIVGAFVSWPTDVLLRPPESLWGRLAQRIADETGKDPMMVPSQLRATPAWEEAQPRDCPSKSSRWIGKEAASHW